MKSRKLSLYLLMVNFFLTGRSARQLKTNSANFLPDRAHLFYLKPVLQAEQFVMIELFYRCQYFGRAYKLSTWRTGTGAEVAVIIETP